MFIELLASALLIGAAYKYDKKQAKEIKKIEKDIENVTNTMSTSPKIPEAVTPISMLDKLHSDTDAQELTDAQKILLAKIFGIANLMDTLEISSISYASPVQALVARPYERIIDIYFHEFEGATFLRDVQQKSDVHKELTNLISTLTTKAGVTKPLNSPTYSTQAIFYLKAAEHQLTTEVDVLYDFVKSNPTWYTQNEVPELLGSLISRIDAQLSQAKTVFEDFQKNRLKNILNIPKETDAPIDTSSLKDLLQETPDSQTVVDMKHPPKNPFDALEKSLYQEKVETPNQASTLEKMLKKSENVEKELNANTPKHYADISFEEVPDDVAVSLIDENIIETDNAPTISNKEAFKDTTYPTPDTDKPQ